MIKVKNSNVEIKASEGIPEVMTNLTLLLRGVRSVAKDEGLSEENADELINHCVRLSKASTEELNKEAKDVAEKAATSILGILFGQLR